MGARGSARDSALDRGVRFSGMPFGEFRVIGGPLQALLPVAVQGITLLVHILDRFQAQLQPGGLEGTQNLLGHEIVHRPGFESATR